MCERALCSRWWLALNATFRALRVQLGGGQDIVLLPWPSSPLALGLCWGGQSRGNEHSRREGWDPIFPGLTALSWSSWDCAPGTLKYLEAVGTHTLEMANPWVRFTSNTLELTWLVLHAKRANMCVGSVLPRRRKASLLCSGWWQHGPTPPTQRRLFTDSVCGHLGVSLYIELSRTTFQANFLIRLLNNVDW